MVLMNIGRDCLALVGPRCGEVNNDYVSLKLHTDTLE